MSIRELRRSRCDGLAKIIATRAHHTRAPPAARQQSLTRRGLRSQRNWRTILIRPTVRTAWTVLALAACAAIAGNTQAQQAEPRGKTSYMPVDITEPFASIMSRMVAAKP